MSGVNPADARVLGDERFLGRIGRGVRRPDPSCTLEDLVKEGCRIHGVRISDLLSANRQRRLTKVRAWIADQTLARQIASLSEVARQLRRDESSLRELVSRHHPRRSR